MILKVDMYTVQCDNCKCTSGDYPSEYSAWNDKNGAEEEAMESGWTREEDNHYCPECYEYDDEDNLVVKKERKKQLI